MNETIHYSAINAVEEIISELSGRKGLLEGFDCFDEDIQDEVKQELVDIIKNNFKNL